MSTDKRIIEAIPPRRQWDPRVVSGVKRVNTGEDPDRVALDLAMVVPGFTRTQLGAYTAAYNKLRQKKVKESAEMTDIVKGKTDSGSYRASSARGVVVFYNSGEQTRFSLADIYRAVYKGDPILPLHAREFMLKDGYTEADIASYLRDGKGFVYDKTDGSISNPDIMHYLDEQLLKLLKFQASNKKTVREGLFGGEEPDVADRDNKEQAVQALLGSEDVDVKKVPDEKLTGLIQGLGSITAESIDSQVSQIVSVMREQRASRNDVLEALRVHVGFNLREAKEVLQEYLQEGAPKEGNVRKVDYKGYTITVHKNRAGMFTAKNDSGEPYTTVPHFRSAEAAIAWDKKNVDQMTESSSPDRTGVRYGVFSRGGSVGSKHNGPVETFDTVEDAKQYAARLRKTLTPGERKYYKMGYVVRALKEAKENMWPKETTCNSCEKDFSYNYEELKTYETIYEGGLTAVEYVSCPHCEAEVITHI